MAICAGCKQQVPDDVPLLDREPCPDPSCGSKGRVVSEFAEAKAVARSAYVAVTEREGRTVGYSESPRDGTESTADVVGGCIESLIQGRSPQGEQDTLETVERLVSALNARSRVWEQPTLADLPKTDAIALHIELGTKKVLRMQVVKADAGEARWRRLANNGSVADQLSLTESAALLRAAVEKKAENIDINLRSEITLVLDANRTPGLSFPEVVDEYRLKFAEWTRSLGFSQVFVVGPTENLVFALDD